MLLDLRTHISLSPRYASGSLAVWTSEPIEFAIMDRPAPNGVDHLASIFRPLHPALSQGEDGRVYYEHRLSIERHEIEVETFQHMEQSWAFRAGSTVIVLSCSNGANWMLRLLEWQDGEPNAPFTLLRSTVREPRLVCEVDLPDYQVGGSESPRVSVTGRRRDDFEWQEIDINGTQLRTAIREHVEGLGLLIDHHDPPNVIVRHKPLDAPMLQEPTPLNIQELSAKIIVNPSSPKQPRPTAWEHLNSTTEE